MRFSSRQKLYPLTFLMVLLSSFAFGVSAATIGETKSFNLDQSYDSQKREEILATLVLESDKLYLYVDNSLWDSFSDRERYQTTSNLVNLSEEFKNKIYPVLTYNFGTEWIPGIDRDRKITVLFHPLRKGAGGYFSELNEYSKFENPNSNEREMVYLNADYLASPLLKSLLAHEFTHLITFNQKERIRKTKEEVWLNEARAEYAVTLLEYNNIYQGSYLQKRVNDFLKNPENPLMEWTNSLNDYGPINLFVLYLVDHYGMNILNDSLHYDKVGIESINYALSKNGYKEDFSQVFIDWTITVLMNDCSLGAKYCYKNKSVSNVKILPTNNFALTDLLSNLTVNYSVRGWAGDWHRILASAGLLSVEFNGSSGRNFKISYILCDFSNNCSVKPLNLDENNQGKIDTVDIAKYPYFIIIPSLQEVHSSIGNATFFLNIKMINQEDSSIEQLLGKINFLKSEIARLQVQLLPLQDKIDLSCSTIKSNLYFGIKDDSEVRCLQEFLKRQGPEIYPEGLITGNFLDFTKVAVVRFQEKYNDGILKPLGLKNGTGYVGPSTRAKINELI